MKDLYLAADGGELERLRRAAERLIPRAESFIDWLRKEMDVRELPATLVWTGEEGAKRISGISLPAFTNEHRIVMCPEIEVWRELYLRQLDPLAPEDPRRETIRAYYEALGEEHVLQILGHELCHHSERFPEDFDAHTEGVWFEEGMVEYISRRFFLTGAAFDRTAEINALLASVWEERNGRPHLESLRAENEGKKDLADAFYLYWRSFLAVREAVERCGGVEATFRARDRWTAADRPKLLSEWFGLE